MSSEIFDLEPETQPTPEDQAVITVLVDAVRGLSDPITITSAAEVL